MKLKYYFLAVIILIGLSVNAQQRREIKATDAGQIPEKTKASIGNDGEDQQNDTQRMADLKKLADELVNAVAFDDIVWNNKKDGKLTKADAGNALNARATDLEDSDGDGYADEFQNDQSSQRATGDLKSIYPPGNKTSIGRFSSFDEIDFFAWQYLGKEIANANYVIEITKIGNDGQAQQTFVGQSNSRTGRHPQTGKEIKIANAKVAKFKAGKALADVVKRTGNPDQGGDAVDLTPGKYRWMVKETTTGISSEPSYFSISEEKNNSTGFNEKSAMLIVKIDQTALRNTNTILDNSTDARTLKADKRLDVRALRANDARHGLRANQRDERMKNAKVTDERIKDIRANNVRANDVRATKVDERHKGINQRLEPVNKPIEITEESFKSAPQNGIDTKYVRIQNHQTVQISKGYLQLIAPFLPNLEGSSINYRWIVKNTKQNIDASFQGTSIQYQFEAEGTYEIEITPIVGQKSLDSFSATIICN